MSTVNPGPNPYATPVAISDLDGVPMAGTMLATRGDRLAGALIDFVIMFPIILPVSFGLGIGIVMMGMAPESLLTRLIAAFAGGLIGAVVFLAINGYLLANRGQTVGKIVMKTMIVSEETGEKLSFAQLISLRYLPIWVLSSLPYVGWIVSLANALAIFRENHKCFHDDLARTKVIKLQ